MKISIFSDLHLGFAHETERKDDCFDAFEEALEKSLDSDLILIPGDIFDTKNPSTETITRAMELLLNMMIIKNDIKLVAGIGKDIKKLSPINMFGIPVIALHGNHERRAKGLINPVQALEKAGFLIYIHCDGVILEKDGERVAIQGISAVPDKYFDEVLKEWNPKPIDGCFNIFMLHQILGEFFRSEDSLKTSSLPHGFDLYIDGDIHKPQKSIVNGKPLIIAGSLVPTQLSEDETGAKGMWTLDTKTKEIKFIPLENQRKFYFEKFEKADKEVIEKRINEILSHEHKKRPVIRIKLNEKFEWDKEIEAKYEDKAIISFKQVFKEEEIQAKTLEEHKLSVQEMAKKLLRENLEKFNLNPRVFETAFELIVEGKNDDALSLLKDSIDEKKDSTSQEISEKQHFVEHEIEKKPEEVKTKDSSGIEQKQEETHETEKLPETEIKEYGLHPISESINKEERKKKSEEKTKEEKSHKSGLERFF
jgi:DNA repair exonuclease SbcCD nuclease subunit